MIARVESMSLHDRITKLEQELHDSEGAMKGKFTEFIKNSPDIGPSPEERQKEKEAIGEQMDRKVEAAFERLRNDNQYIWK